MECITSETLTRAHTRNEHPYDIWTTLRSSKQFLGKYYSVTPFPWSILPGRVSGRTQGTLSRLAEATCGRVRERNIGRLDKANGERNQFGGSCSVCRRSEFSLIYPSRPAMLQSAPRSWRPMQQTTQCWIVALSDALSRCRLLYGDTLRSRKHRRSDQAGEAGARRRGGPWASESVECTFIGVLAWAFSVPIPLRVQHIGAGTMVSLSIAFCPRCSPSRRRVQSLGQRTGRRLVVTGRRNSAPCITPACAEPSDHDDSVRYEPGCQVLDCDRRHGSRRCYSGSIQAAEGASRA